MKHEQTEITGKGHMAPLADRMRPKNIDEFVGQTHVLGERKFLRRVIQSGQVVSMIFWGPPGSGKTTLAKIIAERTQSHFISFSAVLSGVKDIRNVVKEAKERLKSHHQKTILFVDEIHRFNKAQQDAFLPHVESGLITLIGATTENPSFEIISPLLSRTRTVVLNPLSPDEIEIIVKRVLEDKERGLGTFEAHIDNDALSHIIAFADGDARRALNALEVVVLTTPPDSQGRRKISLEAAQEATQKRMLLYDKSGEEHYNLISAFHKSMRGSDPDAALYWLARMIEAGEDPLYIARRMIRFASEDVGNADPKALEVAVSALHAFQVIGLPEGDLALAQAAVYLATAPKSNALYKAYEGVKRDIGETGYLPVPLHIRNAPTALMRKLGYGKGYKYAHNFPQGFVNQQYLPDDLKGKVYYLPSKRGYEVIIKERLEKWRKK